MRAAGLTAISTVVESTAVLIKNKHPSNPELIQRIAGRLRGVISKRCVLSKVLIITDWHCVSTDAKKYILCTYNIRREDFTKAADITPGKRAPTVTQLEQDGWVAVQAMVESSLIANTMDELEKIGAEDILVMKLDNTRTKA